jgi:hypothetical protein
MRTFAELVDEQRARNRMDQNDVRDILKPDRRACLASKGDISGLLSFLRAERLHCLTGTDFAAIRITLSNLQSNLPGLIDAGFGEIFQFTLQLLARFNLLVERQLAQADRWDPHHGGLPPGLIDELERCERLARFFSEMATNYARVRHVRSLAAQESGKNANETYANGRCAVAGVSRQARARKRTPRNGCVVRKEGPALDLSLSRSNT